ncbi:hypothetical protein I4U23_005044 [Adineta vaga]|nr:hypothetical protein I4U23_005044 [Adineta vaga]
MGWDNPIPWDQILFSSNLILIMPSNNSSFVVESPPNVHEIVDLTTTTSIRWNIFGIWARKIPGTEISMTIQRGSG